MYTTKIVNVETKYANNEHFIEVVVEIYRGEGEESVHFDTRKFGYPLDTTREEILADHEKLCATLTSDEKVGRESEELDKQLTAVEDLKKELLS